jgi:hypothetical protein
VEDEEKAGSALSAPVGRLVVMQVRLVVKKSCRSCIS